MGNLSLEKTQVDQHVTRSRTSASESQILRQCNFTSSFSASFLLLQRSLLFRTTIQNQKFKFLAGNMLKCTFQHIILAWVDHKFTKGLRQRTSTFHKHHMTKCDNAYYGNDTLIFTKILNFWRYQADFSRLKNQNLQKWPKYTYINNYFGKKAVLYCPPQDLIRSGQN